MTSKMRVYCVLSTAFMQLYHLSFKNCSSPQGGEGLPRLLSFLRGYVYVEARGIRYLARQPGNEIDPKGLTSAI